MASDFPVTESLEADFCVVGGGIAGLCAALAAARSGLHVVLVQNRPMLGGNASSEIRQHIGGAAFMGHFPEAREGGLTDEVWSSVRRNCLTNDLNDMAESSLSLQDICRREPGLRLVLNTHVDVVACDRKRIVRVEGTQSSTGKRISVSARQFADCSGDAHVAFLAGCRFMSGQEGRGEYGESLAPPRRRKLTMGNTLLFQSEKLPFPVEFKKPDWVPDLSTIDCYWTLHPQKAPLTHGSWVFEYGGKLDTVLDAEEIHQELIKIVYAAWADLKKRFPQELACHRLSFISALPGKRESRRVVGDYVLSQNDIVQTRRFRDDVAYAGWSLDLHTPNGFYGKERPTTFCFFPEVHSIPLRCLYAADMNNLWLAGRDISVTHIALGGARVMASCGLQGEAIGIAAAHAHRRELDCRQTAKKAIPFIQQEILKRGGYIPGVINQDITDLARQASRLEATSEAVVGHAEPEGWEAIGDGIGLAFPVTAGRLDSLALPVDNPTGAAVTLRAVLKPIRWRRDFRGGATVARAQVTVPPGPGTAVLPLAAELSADLWMVHLFSDEPGLQLGVTTRRMTGVHVADHFPQGKPDMWARELGVKGLPKWVRRFNHKRLDNPDLFHATPCFTLQPPQPAFGARNVINGLNRAERLPNLWASDPARPLPQTLSLAWDEPVAMREIRLVFDADMDYPMPPLRPFDTLVADYRIVAWKGRKRRQVAKITGNEKRLAVHAFAEMTVDRLDIHVERLHREGRQARIYEVRCY